MQFAADYPGYCEKLVLLASGSTRGYPFYGVDRFGQPNLRLKTYEDIQTDRMKTIPTQRAYDTKDRTFIKTVWDFAIYTKNKPEEQRYKEYVEEVFTQRNLAEVYHALNTFNISEKHNGLIEGNGLAKNINIPVLVLHGDRDLVVTDEMTKEILEDLGSVAKFKELKDCGHSPLLDNLGQLLREMTDFLEE
jgi:pimeloyl-ACP methyl ester carboxylesterase